MQRTTTLHHAQDERVKDAGNYFTGTDVETALQELGANQLLPFGVYQNISPMSTSPSYPYAQSLHKSITLVKWTQEFYVAAPNDGSNYWTIYLRAADFSVVASISTSGSAADTQTLLSTTSFSINPVGTSDLMLFIGVNKTGSPGAIYVAGPALEYHT